MKRMSFSETIFLFFLALVIFGPKKLPEIARQVGKYLNEFKRASNEFKAQIEQEIAHLEVEQKQTILPPSPAPEGTASRTLSAASNEASPAQADSASANPETASAEAPATLAASAEEPVITPHAPEPAGEPLPAAEAVASPASQESHA